MNTGFFASAGLFSDRSELDQSNIFYKISKPYIYIHIYIYMYVLEGIVNAYVKHGISEVIFSKPALIRFFCRIVGFKAHI